MPPKQNVQSPKKPSASGGGPPSDPASPKSVSPKSSSSKSSKVSQKQGARPAKGPGSTTKPASSSATTSSTATTEQGATSPPQVVTTSPSSSSTSSAGTATTSPSGSTAASGSTTSPSSSSSVPLGTATASSNTASSSSTSPTTSASSRQATATAKSTRTTTTSSASSTTSPSSAPTASASSTTSSATSSTTPASPSTNPSPPPSTSKPATSTSKKAATKAAPANKSLPSSPPSSSSPEGSASPQLAAKVTVSPPAPSSTSVRSPKAVREAPDSTLLTSAAKTTTTPAPTRKASAKSSISPSSPAGPKPTAARTTPKTGPQVHQDSPSSPTLPPAVPSLARTSSTSSTASSKGEPEGGGQKWDRQLKAAESIVIQLKRREIHGSGQVATKTAEILRTCILQGRYASVYECLEMIRTVGKTLANAQPIELCIGNIVRRVLYIVRHEFTVLQTQETKNPNQQQSNVDLSLSLHRLLDKQATAEIDFSKPFVPTLKNDICAEITTLIESIRNVHKNVAEQAVEHIYAKEVVLTFGISGTVLEFLKEAGKYRAFEVIVVESAPSYEGQKMAVQLAEAGIETTVITDSAVFAIMSNVSKVVVGTHGVMANGGLIAHSGAHNIAVAAKHYKVPFVVITGLHKLCPLYAFDQDTFNEHHAPSEVLRFEEEVLSDSVEVVNPGYDYVEPELVTLFVTDFVCRGPSYIYRLLAEYYNAEDYTL